MILGTQKGGTSSLFAYLAGLPEVVAPETKEIQYFSEMLFPNSYRLLGNGWYRSNFPLRRELRNAGAITGEATPRYMVEQLAMTAAAAALRRSFPAAIADAFLETRLGKEWRLTYGMLDSRFDARAFIDYLYPQAS